MWNAATNNEITDNTKKYMSRNFFFHLYIVAIVSDQCLGVKLLMLLEPISGPGKIEWIAVYKIKHANESKLKTKR